MKKIVLLFALLFTVSTSFISCRDTTQNGTENVNDGDMNANDGMNTSEGTDSIN